MTGTVVKTMDIKNEPEQELAKLPYLKEDALTVIRRVENEEYKPLPEKRYLCYENRDDIALDLSSKRIT